MATITMTPAEINRWNNDDQAIGLLSDLHWDRFFDEPKRTHRHGVATRAFKKYLEGLGLLQRAAARLRAEHGPDR